MFKSIPILVLLATLYGLSGNRVQAQSQPASPGNYQFSLQQAMDYALQHKNDVLNAQLDVTIAQRQAQEILATSFPQISGSVQLQDYLALPTQLLPGEFFGAPAGTYIPVKFGTQYNMSAGITATQLIADGSYFVAAKGTAALIDLSKKNSERTDIETKVAVSKAYYSVLVNRRSLSLLDANISRLQKLKDDTKALLDNGFVEKLDYNRVMVGYNNLVTEKEKVNQLLILNNYLLKYQMGMDVNASLTLTDSLTEDLLHVSDLENQTFNPQNRIEFQLLQTQRTLYGLDVKRNKMSYLPSLAAFGTLSYSAQRTEFNFFNNDHWFSTGIVGLQLSVPIFDGFAKERRIQQGQLKLQQNANDELNLQNALQMEMNASRITLDNALKTLHSQKENMKLAEEVYDEAKKKFDAGVGSNLETINAQTDLKTAQNNYLEALYEALVARVDLMKALGSVK